MSAGHYAIEFTTVGGREFSASCRYQRNLAEQYVIAVSLEISKKGFAFVFALPGVPVPVESVRMTRDGVPV